MFDNGDGECEQCCLFSASFSSSSSSSYYFPMGGGAFVVVFRVRNFLFQSFLNFNSILSVVG